MASDDNPHPIDVSLRVACCLLLAASTSTRAMQDVQIWRPCVRRGRMQASDGVKVSLFDCSGFEPVPSPLPKWPEIHTHLSFLPGIPAYCGCRASGGTQIRHSAKATGMECEMSPFSALAPSVCEKKVNSSVTGNEALTIGIMLRRKLDGIHGIFVLHPVMHIRHIHSRSRNQPGRVRCPRIPTINPSLL